MERELKEKAMKTKSITILSAAVILLGVSEAWATSIAFYEDGVIQEGDVYSEVAVFNNAKVDMTGGVVTIQFTTWGSSTANVSGGILEALVSVETSTLNLSGDAQIDSLGVSDSGFTNMYGGTVGSMKAWNHSTVNLYGGIISEYLEAYGTEDLVISIYGYGFEYDPLAGDYRGGQLTGFWLDDTPFSIDLYYEDEPSGPLIDTWSHIMLIPEPATILLLGLGAIDIRIIKFRKGESNEN